MKFPTSKDRRKFTDFIKLIGINRAGSCFATLWSTVAQDFPLASATSEEEP